MSVLVAAMLSATKPSSGSRARTTHPYGSFDETKIGEFDRTPGTFSWEIVGESHYQDALEKMAGGRTEDSADVKVLALVVPENDNPHDPNAVAIHMDEGVVGYLSRDDARAYRQALAANGHSGIAFRVPAKIVGGWLRENGDIGFFGVKLDLPR